MQDQALITSDCVPEHASVGSFFWGVFWGRGGSFFFFSRYGTAVATFTSIMLEIFLFCSIFMKAYICHVGVYNRSSVCVYLTVLYFYTCLGLSF